MDAPFSPAELDALEAEIGTWLTDQLEHNPVVAAVERGEPGERRWYVRLRGEEKDVYSVWYTLGQRTLHYETYFMPAPVENREGCYRYLLARNAELYGMAFCIGAEEAVFLSGQLGNGAVDREELDRVLGTFYATVERCFRPAMRLGYSSAFT